MEGWLGWLGCSCSGLCSGGSSRGEKEEKEEEEAEEGDPALEYTTLLLQGFRLSKVPLLLMCKILGQVYTHCKASSISVACCPWKRSGSGATKALWALERHQWFGGRGDVQQIRPSKDKLLNHCVCNLRRKQINHGTQKSQITKPSEEKRKAPKLSVQEI